MGAEHDSERDYWAERSRREAEARRLSELLDGRDRDCPILSSAVGFVRSGETVEASVVKAAVVLSRAYGQLIENLAKAMALQPPAPIVINRDAIAGTTGSKPE